MKINHAPILLIEDDSNDVLLIQRAFRRAELDIPLRVVRDGREAMSYLQGQPPFDDRVAYPVPLLVLLDLKMPVRSGFEVIAWVRAHPGLKRLPLVVLTSSREIEDVNRAYEAGASSYLVKPVAFEALQTMLSAFGRYWLNFNVPPEITDRLHA
jgi:CheY-like chemotaxis protein